MANTKNHALLPDQKIFALIIGLCEEISNAASTTEAAGLLASLFTPQEIRMLAIRSRIKEMLLNKASYREIKEELGVSFGTISRVRLSLEHVDKRPRSESTETRVDANNEYVSQAGKTKRISGPLAKYSSGGWPIQLLASVLKEIVEARPPPK